MCAQMLASHNVLCGGPSQRTPSFHEMRARGPAIQSFGKPKAVARNESDTIAAARVSSSGTLPPRCISRALKRKFPVSLAVRFVIEAPGMAHVPVLAVGKQLRENVSSTVLVVGDPLRPFGGSMVNPFPEHTMLGGSKEASWYKARGLMTIVGRRRSSE